MGAGALFGVTARTEHSASGYSTDVDDVCVVAILQVLEENPFIRVVLG
jgi:hypothetical protein